MVAIQGIGGIPEPTPERPATVRERREKENAKSVRAQDGVVISSEAQAAARLASSVQIAKSLPDVRAEKVAAAKERIERGEYKQPEVVAKVAERISKFIP